MALQPATHIPWAWMDATGCTLGQVQLLWLVQQYSCAHTGLCQGGAGLAPVQWGAGCGDQRGLAGLYLCPEGCRPTHSQRSSTCVAQGSPGHRCSGWGRQQLSAGHVSEGRTRVWLEGRLRVWHAASLAPLLTTPLPFNGGCRHLGLPQGILSLAWGSPGHLTWLSKHAAGAAAAGAALVPRAACGVVVTSCPTAWPDGTASTGAVSRALCRGRCFMQLCPWEQGLLQRPRHRHQFISHPSPDPHTGIPWSEQQYLWWAGGRSRPSRSGSTSQHQGSHGRRDSTVWRAKGPRSPPPGTDPLWGGQAGPWGSSVPAGPDVGMQ